MVRRPTLVLLALTLAACGPKLIPVDGDGDGEGVPYIPPEENGPSEESLGVGGTGRVTADFLNLRDGVGTMAHVIATMPCGAPVRIMGGPSATPVAGWWKVEYIGADLVSTIGWASGNYLVNDIDFVDGTCGVALAPDGADLGMGGDGAVGSGVDMAGTSTMSPIATQMLARAKLGVGYSYWWGHGAWRSDGASPGSCSGSCPSCNHSGSYGADCSGYISKIWQVPTASAISVDQHPYSTKEFYNDQTYWTQIARNDLQPVDALVYRTSSSGHIVLFESGADPYGALWIYEARGCSTGVQHNLRPISSSYRAIRRNGL